MHTKDIYFGTVKLARLVEISNNKKAPINPIIIDEAVPLYYKDGLYQNIKTKTKYSSSKDITPCKCYVEENTVIPFTKVFEKSFGKYYEDVPYPIEEIMPKHISKRKVLKISGR